MNMQATPQGTGQTTAESQSKGHPLEQTPKKMSLEEKYASQSNQPSQAPKQGAVEEMVSASQEVEQEVSEQFEGDESSNEQEEDVTEEFEQDEFDKSKLKEKIKYKGQEIEVDYDTLVKLAHRGAAMEVSQQEAALSRKQIEKYENLFQGLQSNAESFFELGKLMGHDIKKLAHEKIMEDMETNLMSPEEKELYELRKWKAKEEKRIAEMEQASQREKEEREYQEVTGRLQTEVISFFQENAIKPTPAALARTFDNMIMALDRTGQRMPIAKAYQLAQNQIKAESKQWLQGLSPEEFAELPPEFARKFREQGLKNLNRGKVQPSSQGHQRTPAKNKQKFESIDALFDHIGKRWS